MAARADGVERDAVSGVGETRLGIGAGELLDAASAGNSLYRWVCQPA